MKYLFKIIKSKNFDSYFSLNSWESVPSLYSFYFYLILEMRWIKVLGYFCVIFFWVLCSVEGVKKIAKGVQSFRLTKVECWTSGITLLPKYECYVKAYSRSYASLNVNWKFNRPLTNFKVWFSLNWLILYKKNLNLIHILI